MNVESLFAQYEAKSSWETIGSVRTLAGKGGKVRPTLKSMRNHKKDPENKTIAFAIERADGKSVVISCVPEVAKKLDNKQISPSQFLSLPVIATKGEDGAIITMIALPQTAIAAIEVDKVKEEKLDLQPEELMVW